MFNKIVYTPLSEALKLLEERQNNPELMKKVDEILGADTLKLFAYKKKFAVLFRQIATPNYETRRFMALAEENDLQTLFFEYLDDKFTPENEYKHSLGQLHIQKEVDRKGYSQIERKTIVDFHPFSGKKLWEVRTLWNKSLIDFHRELFGVYNYKIKDFDFYDASKWLKKNGECPVDYYTKFFILLSCHGILFENFLTTKDGEGDFSKYIVLPAIERAMNITGLKPLIVPIEPLDMETDKYWISYDKKAKGIIPKT